MTTVELPEKELAGSGVGSRQERAPSIGMQDGWPVLVLLALAVVLFGIMPLGRLILTALAPSGTVSFAPLVYQIGRAHV